MIGEAFMGKYSSVKRVQPFKVEKRKVREEPEVGSLVFTADSN